MALMEFLKRIFVPTYLYSFLFIFCTLLTPINSLAAPAWKIISDQSNITFTAVQNDAPVSGEFKNFTGEINFDPSDLTTSNVRIFVDLNSVSTSYQQVADTLKTVEWFDVKNFPQAIFKTTRFTKTTDDNYQAEGTLTLRDKTQPVTLNFTLDKYSKSQAHAKGTMILKRTAFGVGQGEWAKTDQIKDEVKVEFTLTATSAS